MNTKRQAFIILLLFAAAISVSGQEVKSGDLVISSDHAGVSVEIDGKPVPGETPLTLKGISAGEHRITVRKGTWLGAQKTTLAAGDVSRVSIPMQD